MGRAERLDSLSMRQRCLGGGLFTVTAGDNIDHNLSSLTAKSLYHGTAIPLMQFPTDDHPGLSLNLLP